MGGIRKIFKKELDRIFKDKKTIFSVFFLPVLIMIVLLTIINNLTSNMEDDIESHKSQIYVKNMPDSFEDVLEMSEMKYHLTDVSDEGSLDQAKNKILEGDADLIVEFPADFEAVITNYQKGDVIPQVKTYENPSEEYSQAASKNIAGVLESYRQSLLSQRVADMDALTVFQVNADNDEMYIQDEGKAGGKAIGTMLPYFITILLFAGAMGIGTDMIAGEKERGTMASLLVSPVKRKDIVLGKVFALMLISGLSSLIYVAAMVICAPIMMSNMGGLGDLDVKLSPQQILMLGALLVAMAFLYAGIIALISVFARSVKEASTYVMPIYMLVLVVGLLTMFTSGEVRDSYYFIPLYNNALVLQGVLAQETTVMQFVITLVETLAIGGIITGVIVKAFESEKVMAA